MIAVKVNSSFYRNAFMRNGQRPRAERREAGGEHTILTMLMFLMDKNQKRNHGLNIVYSEKV